MIAVTCVRCEGELSEPGALVFSPPGLVIDRVAVFKHHLCLGCHEDLISWLSSPPVDRDTEADHSTLLSPEDNSP